MVRVHHLPGKHMALRCTMEKWQGQLGNRAIHVDSATYHLPSIVPDVAPFMQTIFLDGRGLFQLCQKHKERFGEHINEFEVLTWPLNAQI